MKRFLTLSLVLLIALFSTAQTYVQTFNNFFNSRLSTYNNNVLVVIGCGDNVLYTYQNGAYGVNDKLDLQSLSKWVTSAVIMSLVKAQKLTLDDKISTHISAWNTSDKQNITIRQILAHTSGIKETDYDSRTDITLDSAVRLMAGVPLHFTPGTQFGYGSGSYKVAARVAEIVEGKSWKQIFADRIKSLSGMPNATFSARPGFSDLNPLTGNGLECSINEFSNFMKMILRFGDYNGTSVLDYNSVVTMQTKQNTAGVENYGLGQHRDMMPSPNNTVVKETWHPSASGCLAWVNREKNYYGVIITQAGFGATDPTNQQFRSLVQDSLPGTVCTPVQPCDFALSTSGPTGNVNTSTSITLNSSCSGPCTGVTYSWSGTGISGGNTNSSVTFNAPSTPGTYTYTLTASKSGCTNKTSTRQVTVVTPPAGGACVVNKVRLQFRSSPDCCYERLVGAKIQGSNNGGGSWTDLYTFTGNGNGSFQEFTFGNTTSYSSARFVASSTGWGELRELEFYNGTTKLTGTTFGTDNYANAFDGNSATEWHAPTSPGSSNVAGMNFTGCSAPTGCDFNVVATASPTSVFTSGPVSLSFVCTGANCNTATFNWSGQTISGNQNPKSINAPASAGNYTYTLTATKTGCTTKSDTAKIVVATPSGGTGCIVNKVRLKFRQSGECCMDRLPGAKIQGSNNGTTWTDIYTFTTNGTGSWQDFPITNSTAYSSVRFQASATGWGELYELEFYKGTAKLTGTPFGVGNYANAFDGNLSTDWQVSSNPGTGNHAGLNNLGNCAGSPLVLDMTDPGAINNQLQLLVSPNPSNGILNAGFYLARGNKATIVINDLQGRTIYRQAVTGNGQHNEKIHLVNKSSGTFILRLETPAGVEVRKINIAR